MTPEQQKVQVEKLFETLEDSHSSLCGYVIRAMKTVTVDNFDMIRPNIIGLFSKENFATAVRFIGMFCKGEINRHIPWIIRQIPYMNTDKLVDWIIDWIIENEADMLAAAKPGPVPVVPPAKS